jgi:hypothetical protein
VNGPSGVDVQATSDGLGARLAVTGSDDLARRARAAASRVHASPGWAWARRYLPVYRWAADLEDKTIAAFVAAGWGLWLLGGLLTAVLGRLSALPAGLLLAAIGAVVDTAVVRWWLGYRRSPARLRHQVLARPQIAAGRELADSSMAHAQVVALGAHVRPALAAAGPRTAGSRVLTATGPHRATRDLHPGELAGCPQTSAPGGERSC